uniref:Uncharacterized protein n=1 Tax=Lactuca sativa TaxID=4236 RepID=A0A9R1VIT8_LACSA|nr:hypothetical protein LSAT_V11C500256520 [Lactuca sativa]
MSEKDIENEAHKHYEAMRQMGMANHGITHSHPTSEEDNEESSGITKRSRQRPTGRDAAERKGKGKVSIEIVEERHVIRLSRDTEVMKKNSTWINNEKKQSLIES